MGPLFTTIACRLPDPEAIYDSFSHFTHAPYEEADNVNQRNKGKQREPHQQ